MIIRGRNYYPLDIERSVEASHAGIRRGGVAAVAVHGENREERLAIVAEVRRSARTDPAEILAAVRHVVASDHELRPARILLVVEGRLPRTTSGKTQRLAVASMLDTGE